MQLFRKVMCKNCVRVLRQPRRRSGELCRALSFARPRKARAKLVVPPAGIEPALDYSKQILSLQRLPIPPRGHEGFVAGRWGKCKLWTVRLWCVRNISSRQKSKREPKGSPSPSPPRIATGRNLKATAALLPVLPLPRHALAHPYLVSRPGWRYQVAH